MEKQLDRIEKKLDLIDSKLDNHVQRIARVEASGGWIKLALTFLFTALGSIALALSKLKI